MSARLPKITADTLRASRSSAAASAERRDGHGRSTSPAPRNPGEEGFGDGMVTDLVRASEYQSQQQDSAQPVQPQLLNSADIDTRARFQHNEERCGAKIFGLRPDA